MKSTTSRIALILGLTLLPLTAFAGTTEDVSKALSGYHFSGDLASLEKIAGGKENLINALLELRTTDAIPFVAIRAERLLVSYADEERVHNALSADLGSEHKGLARTVVLHLDKAPSTARESLARKAVERASHEEDFKPFARSLASSSDAKVRELARSVK